MIWKILTYALIGYMALLLLVFVLQRKMLYYPDGSRLPEAYAQKAGLRSWPSAKDFRGYIGAVEKEGIAGTIIVFHGNAGAAYHRRYYVDALSRLGLAVILAEYPGYGGREGNPGESVLVEDALETIRLAYQAYKEPIYLWGESLGAGVAAAAIQKSAVPIKGVVLFTPWDSLPDVAQTHYWYFPSRWLVMEQYNSIRNLKAYQGHVAVVLAGNDKVIPVKHGRRLYDAITTRKQLWRFAGAGHNTMPIEPHLSWWREVIEFITE